MYFSVLEPFSILVAFDAPFARSISAFTLSFSASKFRAASLIRIQRFCEFSPSTHFLLPDIVNGTTPTCTNQEKQKASSRRWALLKFGFFFMFAWFILVFSAAQGFFEPE
jgi:hypothetical protein